MAGSVAAQHVSSSPFATLIDRLPKRRVSVEQSAAELGVRKLLLKPDSKTLCDLASGPELVLLGILPYGYDSVQNVVPVLRRCCSDPPMSIPLALERSKSQARCLQIRPRPDRQSPMTEAV